MLELIFSLQKDKPDRQLGKFVAALMMKISRSLKEWKRKGRNPNSLEKR